ncbi:MAG: DUF192 domain-containing protein [Sphingosinicella sp.]|nr:DUF192 domain-containing protein [Sphingosinicella sp.]
MIFRSFLIAAALTASLGACRAESTQAVPQPSRISSQEGLDRVPLRVRTPLAAHEFQVEVAATAEQQATGLMFVERLKPDEGMVFPFVPPRPASFWMKNTLIPLDMIFVRADCSIARIAVNTIPQSLEPVGTEEYVAAVLEIAGGRSVELGISEGDCVSWPGGPADGR